MTPYLEFNSVGKTFPGVRALNEITFNIKQGEVHGLVGENGAGKSTLLKILSGAHPPTEGYLSINGEQKDFKNTRSAIDSGVAIIYQELYLVPDMSVAENLLLGHMPKKYGFVDHKKMKKIAQDQLDFIMEDIDPAKKIKELSIAQRQMIEIAKALLQDSQIIAFDEPTSSLSDKETKRLFKIIKNLSENGKAIIYVSHRLEEIFEICNRVTVFRDGERVQTFENMKEVTHDILVSRMVGRDITDVYSYRPRPQGKCILSVKEVMGDGLKKPASFEVKQGEILGFFGLVGAGRTELMRLIYGIDQKSGGKVKIDNKPADHSSPRASVENGLMYCPEDRKYDGIIPVRSVDENINISARRHYIKAGIFIDKKKEAENTMKFIKQLDIKTPSKDQLVGNLSGGNQQKVILARWLSEDVKILIMDEPTRGIDVGTKNEIYHLMYNLTEEEKGIICISSDLPEVMGVSDRIIIMREGEIVASLNRSEFSEEKILSLALPVDEEKNRSEINE